MGTRPYPHFISILRDSQQAEYIHKQEKVFMCCFLHSLFLSVHQCYFARKKNLYANKKKRLESFFFLVFYFIFAKTQNIPPFSRFVLLSPCEKEESRSLEHQKEKENAQAEGDKNGSSKRESKKTLCGS